ncbi:MAG: Glyoxalase family protein [uncultured Sphingomonas sp.]|uniref:Glyoxalase family protein n=1 Tax=uncultured Sphingomonas sp. TaxID=158754 RepID=A0A6J4SWV2_9SPHN|nr:VOC family protein [uncultured Sphingomonas sp.]CAA9507770.1 MAG: Glyoxalase family protein [uncultured Sphingomonas sp.]
MSRMIFINLPVSDLERSVRFYEGIGGRKEPKFSNEAAAMIVLSDVIHVMLLTHPFYSSFTGKPIADAHATSQVILCLSAESPAAVDAMAEAAAKSGGRVDVGRKQEPVPLMYGRDFEDPDGHSWEVMWMDSAAAEQGASAFEQVA